MADGTKYSMKLVIAFCHCTFAGSGVLVDSRYSSHPTYRGRPGCQLTRCTAHLLPPPLQLLWWGQCEYWSTRPEWPTLHSDKHFTNIRDFAQMRYSAFIETFLVQSKQSWITKVAKERCYYMLNIFLNIPIPFIISYKSARKSIFPNCSWISHYQDNCIAYIP